VRLDKRCLYYIGVATRCAEFYELESSFPFSPAEDFELPLTADRTPAHSDVGEVPHHSLLL